MRRAVVRWSSPVVVLAIASFSPAQSGKRAAKTPNPDEPAMHDYILTMDRVNRYAAISQKLRAAAAGDPVMAAEMKKIEDADVYNVEKAALIDNAPHTAAWQDKDREQARQFVKEIADAYDFGFAGEQDLDGRETLVIDAQPRPGYQPHLKDAKFLPRFRFRVWLDRAEKQWVKLDVQCVDTVSVGLFLVRLHKGSNIQIEQVRVNDEVWLPKHVSLKLDARVALLKGVNIAEDVTYRDYKKFRTDTRILPAGELPQPR